MMAERSLPVKLAWNVLRSYLQHGEATQLAVEITPEIEGRAGVFVSIKKNGRLRGCIGTFEPTQADIAGEIRRNTVMAATQDPRFPKIEESELEELEISVDVLSTPEAIDDPSQLDPQRYGVIVRSGWRKGLLLPMLEGVNTVEEQLSIVRQKAGIAPHEEVSMYRFSVTRYH